MLLEQLDKLIFCLLIISINCLQSQDLKKTEAIDINQNTVDNQEIIGNVSASCDLTKNLCDINCCEDQDCSSVELESFDCPPPRPQPENLLFEHHYCDVAASENLEARAFVCIQQVNSPYLGEFYSEDEDYKQDDISNMLQARKKKIRGFTEESSYMINTTIPDDYFHGSFIYKLDKGRKKTNISIPMKIIKEKGFCTERPIRFMVETESCCLHTLSEDACVSASSFNLKHFLSSKLILFAGSSGENISIIPKVQCTDRGFDFVSFSRNIFQQVLESSSVSSGSQRCKGDYKTRLNKQNGVCENVMLRLNYVFKQNHSSITDGEVNVLLGDVPLSIDSFLKLANGKYELKQPINTGLKPIMYLSQYFSVHFKDNETSVSQVKRLGYKLRDILQVVSNHS